MGQTLDMDFTEEKSLRSVVFLEAAKVIDVCFEHL